MSLRLPSLRVLLLVLIAGVSFLVLFSWLALPHLIQYGAQKYIADKTHHRLRLDLPEINPLALRVRIAGLQLDEPDGKPLLGFKALQIELSAASILQRAIVLKSIVLDDPRVVATLHRDGSLNWTALLNALKNKEEKPESPLPRLAIGQVSIHDGELSLSDERENFTTRIAPLAFELQDFSTLADRAGHYHLAASTSLGARLSLDGDASLKTLGAQGRLRIENVDLARFANFVPSGLPIDAPTGMLNASTAYRAHYAKGQLAAELDQFDMTLADLVLAQRGSNGAHLKVSSLALKDGHFDLTQRLGSAQQFAIGQVDLSLPQAAGKPVDVGLGGVILEGLRADLAKHRIDLNQLTLRDGKIRTIRSAKGRIDMLDALTQLKDSLAAKDTAGVTSKQDAQQAAVQLATPAHPTPEAPVPPGPLAAGEVASSPEPWHLKLGAIDLRGFSAGLRDESVVPAADFLVEQITLHGTALDETMRGPYPIRIGAKVRDGGQFDVTGEVRPAQAAADLNVSLRDLALTPLQPYIAKFARLTLRSGNVNVAGRAQIGGQHDGFVGSADIRDLRVIEDDTGTSFVAWRSFGTSKLNASAKRLSIHALVLDGLDTQLLIEKDKTLNAKRLLRTPAESPNVVAGKQPAAAPRSAAPSFIASIEQLRITDSALDFADQSLALPFGTRIHALHGVINGLSNRPAARGQVQLDGDVDDYGSAHAAGELDLADPTGFTDLKVIFRNVEMTRLTPYAATFAGRRIASGKLSLDLDYKIKKRQLEGDNKVIMDQLTLGERVESASAANLPLDLALAILQDSDGRIELGLPVSGSLDDPQFSYGGLIWKALVNVVEKIALSPFRALGALFGGSGGEHFESVDFHFGDATLLPPEREKLLNLMSALKKRPGLSLTIPAVFADQDRPAIQELQLRREVATRAGQVVGTDDDPGPIAIQLPRMQAIVETLFSERLGKDALATMRARFAAGASATGAAAKTHSTEAVTVPTSTPDALHPAMLEQLRNNIAISDAALQALATQRAERIAETLRNAGMAASHLQLATAAKVEASGDQVACKPVPGAAAAGDAASAGPAQNHMR